MIMYIYALIDPRDLEVRYIGKTIDPKNRLRAHIFPHNDAKERNKKMRWTEELKALNLRPIMQVLCVCSSDVSELYEYRYIKLFNYKGQLLNTARPMVETFQLQLELN